MDFFFTHDGSQAGARPIFRFTTRQIAIPRGIALRLAADITNLIIHTAH